MCVEAIQLAEDRVGVQYKQAESDYQGCDIAVIVMTANSSCIRKASTELRCRTVKNGKVGTGVFMESGRTVATYMIQRKELQRKYERWH